MFPFSKKKEALAFLFILCYFLKMKERTLEQWSDVCGIPVLFLEKLLAEGHSLQEAVAWRPLKNHFYYDGNYHSLTSLASISVVLRSTLRDRILRGWGVEKAMFTPVSATQKKVKQITIRLSGEALEAFNRLSFAWLELNITEVINRSLVLAGKKCS